MPTAQWRSEARFTNVKILLSGTFPMKDSGSRENCDSRDW